MRKTLKQLGITTLCAISTLFATPVAARPGVPVSEIYFDDYIDIGDTYLAGTLIVPDQDTTRSAGGRLRRYDVHIAKMFEVTDWQCRNWRRSPIPSEREAGIVWRYLANNGSEWMGVFTIDCQEARNVMSRFEQGGDKSTDIFYFEAKHRLEIPTLRLTGSAQETAQWMRFVQDVPVQTSP